MSDPAVQVALTFDFDGLSPWLQVTTASPSFISRGEFGPVGLERIRKLLAESEIAATFFTPGHTALAYPDSVEALVADGHEIAHHGWVHEGLSSLTEKEERSAIERGLEALESVAGSRPVGFRAPLWDLSTRSTDLLVEYGFSYDSSMAGSDFSPYWCRSGDVASSDEPFVFGEAVDLVELPVAWPLDDVPFFEFVPGVGNLTGLGRTEDVLEIWKTEFSYLADAIGEGCMVVTIHPQSTGRAKRNGLQGDFVGHVLEHRRAEVLKKGTNADSFRAG